MFFYYKRSKKFRVLALSATPGKNKKVIQNVITNLMISKVSARSEKDIDVRKFVHKKKIEAIVVGQFDNKLAMLQRQYE